MPTYRSLDILTPPSIEPVTLAEAKTHLRITDSAEDGYLSALITAARELCESYCSRAFITTQIETRLDRFPTGIVPARPYHISESPSRGIPFDGSTIVLSRAPVQSVESVKYLDVFHVLQTMDSADWELDKGGLSSPGRIEPVYPKAWPETYLSRGAVRIAYTAGYGDTASSVPECVKLAIKLLVGTMYENREWIPSVEGAIAALLTPVQWGDY